MTRVSGPFRGFQSVATPVTPPPLWRQKLKLRGRDRVVLYAFVAMLFWGIAWLRWFPSEPLEDQSLFDLTAERGVVLDKATKEKLTMLFHNTDLSVLQAHLDGPYRDRVLRMRNVDGEGLIHIAAKRGDTAMLALLHRYGVDLALHGPPHHRPMWYALQHGHREFALQLLEWGAEGGGSATKMMWDSDDRELLALLAEQSAHFERRIRELQWPLHMAVFDGNAAKTEVLLSGGIDLNRKDGQGRTAMHWAAFFGHIDLAKLLWQHGAEVHPSDHLGNLPLHRAALHRQAQFIETLLALNGSLSAVNQPNDQGRTPLHVATQIGALEAARVLLQRGADPNWGDSEGLRVCDLALRYRHWQVVRLLREHGGRCIQNKQNQFFLRLIGYRYAGHPDALLWEGR